MAKAQKLIIIAIVLFCFLCLIFAQKPIDTAYAYDLYDQLEDNSQNNPYLISSEIDLADLSSEVLAGDSKSGIYFRLTNNITLDSSFNPIGNLSNQFRGIFNGDNYSITVNIDRPTTYNGVFGAVGLGGAVVNLRIWGSVKGGNNTGSIAGYNLGTIDNCINNANIFAKTAQAESLGGIVGLNYGTVTDCINRGTIQGNRYVGGIVGKNMTTGNSASTVNGIINLGNITSILGNTSSVVGGLVGQNDGIVKNGYNYSQISNTGDNQIGSLIGYFSATANLSGSKNCYNNTRKSALREIGYNAQTQPLNYKNHTMYDFLGKITLVFEPNIMSVKDFDIGYGYLPMLDVFLEDSNIISSVKQLLFETGTGMESEPFVINNIEQWNLFATNTKVHDYTDTFVKLNCNLEQSIPLSSSYNPFNGNFDGNSKTINLTMAGDSFLGVFSYIGVNGIVKNLNTTGWVQALSAYAGSIAGYTSGSIINVTNSAKITAASFAGGIAGEVYNSDNVESFINVKNTGIIEGNYNLGGITGYSYNAITVGAIINSGTVQGSNSVMGNHFGGIFGQIENSLHIEYATFLNSGFVNASRGTYVGGLAGKIENGSIKNSINVGLVTGYSSVGGITGYLKESIEKGILDSVGVVSSITGTRYTAGLVGFMDSDIDIKDSYFSGKFYALPNSSILPATFEIIASGEFVLGLENVYYNSDLIDGEGIVDTRLIVPDIQGVGANYVQLTNVNGSAHGISFDILNENWNIEAMSLGFGYYPIPSNFNEDAVNTIKNAVKYNYFNAGNGASVPFAINKAQQLYNLSYLHNNYNGYANLEYSQTANITLDANFTPIGENKSFTGKYFGNYYKIHNLKVSGAEYSYYGLFGYLDNATIEKVAIASGSIEGVGYLGSIAGLAQNSYIRNSYSLIDIIPLGESYSGGIVGSLSGGEIYASFNAGRVNAKTHSAGGIAGYSNAKIHHSFNMGMITGENLAVAGGIAGNNIGGEILVCYNSGTVKVTTEAYSGGICGISEGTIIDSYTMAKILYVLSGKAGAISGFANPGVNNFITRSFYNTNICPLPPYSGTIITQPFAKTTQEMENASFLGDFSNSSHYQFGIANGQDSHYAPRLTAIMNGNDDIQKYSALSVRLRLFGWNDESLAEWGSENNPYLIANRTQLVELSQLTLTYNYSGYYFALENNIDMRVAGAYSNFNPIGYYSDPQNNRAFNGVFDGKGCKIQYLYIDSVVDYVGLFSMLGKDASVKNLEIDENSQIKTTANHVGSIVGRNMSENGAIDRCVSYAKVQGNTNVGGIVGYTYANTTITNCLFYGTLSGNGNVYGVIGIRNDTVSGVNTTNSWYIVDLEQDYQTNGYNSTLFVDANGEVEVIINSQEDNYNFIIFNLLPSEHFTGAYMDSNDFVVASNNMFYAINNTNLKSMYARFTLPVETNIVGSLGVVNITGQGNYYCGQTVTIKVDFISYGYFVNIFDLGSNKLKDEYQDYDFYNDGEQVWITFSMPHTFEDLSIGKIVNIEIIATDLYLDVITDNAIYDGQSYNASTIILPQGLGYFDNIALRYYFGEQKNFTENTSNAGIYEVRARLVVDTFFGLDADLFLGIYSQEFTIFAKQLYFSWHDSIEKEYDGVSFNNITVSANAALNISGILEKDLAQVMVFGKLNWASSDVGSNIDLSCDNFTLTGGMASNYMIEPDCILSGGLGTITAKNITVTIEESDLVHTYNNSKPVITNVRVSGSLGEVILEYSFAPIQALDNPWDAGAYIVTVSTTNTNYIVELTNPQIVITPIVINTVNYSGYNNLTYNGANLASGIKGTYSTLFSGTDTVNLTYYYEKQPEVGLNEVINAGIYQIKPTLNKNNYVLAESVNTLSFSVKKAVRANALDISITKTTATIGEGNLPITITNNKDGEFRLNKKVLTQRGAVKLINNELELLAYGTITFTITESNCLNFEDSESNQLVLEINPQIVYVGLEKTNWDYGDIINLEFKYSWDNEQTQILTQEEFGKISNFSLPIYRITSDNLIAEQTYEVKILGATSDNCRFFTSNNNQIKINPRRLQIVVEQEDDLNRKIYGEKDNLDRPINYSVIDDVTKYLITELPNGLPLALTGNLQRQAGENVGIYTILQGNLSNPNYDLTFDIKGSYEIISRGIRLEMPSGSEKYAKNYRQQDPELIPKLVDGYSWADGDSINSIYIKVTRMAGEDVGSYNYIADYQEDSGNYRILSFETEEQFVIRQGEAKITSLSITQVTFGDNLATSTIYGSAVYLGQTVDGVFSWTNNRMQVDSMQYFAQIKFTPTDTTNMVEVYETKQVPVAKRKLLVSFEGIFEYQYTGKVVNADYQVQLHNTVLQKTPKARVDIQGEAKNVGEYQIVAILTDDCGGVYDLDQTSKYSSLRVNPAKITVSLESEDIIFGKSFTPTIKYSGFVEGEDEKVLTKRATVGKLPENVGYYMLTPSGAEAQNYTFIYNNGTLVIKKEVIITDNVKLKGTLSPEINLTTSAVSSSTKEYLDISKSIEKVTGNSLLKPSKQEMVEYLKFDIVGTLESNTEYEVKLATPLDNIASFYLVNADGSIQSLTQYTVNEEGNLIFSAGNIKGVGVYKQKDILNTIIGYLPLAGIIIGVILIISLSIFISVFRRKLERARRENRLR